MAAVFAEQRAKASIAGGAVLWMKEVGGLVRFSARERMPRMAVTGGSGSHRRWNFGSELGWAWRAVVARRGRAGLIVILLALALAANALMFAVADSLVFSPAPFPGADRIVEIQAIRGRSSPDQFFSAALLDEWRKQSDLFVSVQGYLSKNIFVMSDGVAEIVGAADVTPGVIDLLGVRPRWGRSLRDGDERDVTTQVVLISEGLARSRFGDPSLAPGKTLTTSGEPLFIAGVMPASFAFPNGRTQIWRALDPRGPLAQGFVGVMSLARMAPGLSLDLLRSQMAQRSAAIGTAGGSGASPYKAEPGTPRLLQANPSGATMFYVLLGAAGCLLLTACANIASLELAGALRRTRVYAVQLALGATRPMMARVALFEGAILITAALAGALGLSWLGMKALEANLPPGLRLASANPIDLDGRAIAYMLLAGILTWLIVSLPQVFRASSSTLMALLKSEDRASATSRAGTLLRRGLMTIEVALAVLLVIGSGLYVRSYRTLLAVDKGFDPSNLAEIGFTIPVQYYAGHGEMHTLAATTLEKLRAVPGVLSASWASAPPSIGSSPFGGLKPEVDDHPPMDGEMDIAPAVVDASYFKVVGFTVRQGRLLREDDEVTAGVITESLARKLWPGGEAVGHRFRMSPRSPWIDVVGVVADLRLSAKEALGSSYDSFYYFTLRPQPGPPPANAPPPRVASGGSWRFLNLIARLDSADRAAAALAAAKSMDSRVRVTLTFAEEKYASQFADVLLATQVTGIFGAIAFLVAVVGVYGVMAFLVAGRTREIGIRMALGADRGDISRLIVRSAAVMVIAGAAAGLVAAGFASKWAASQLFGIQRLDPLTYATVAVVVVATALLATWRPARQAARVDPAITLKAE
jgi:predicted permease